MNIVLWISQALVALLIGAMILHSRRGDGIQAVMMNLVLLQVAGFVAYGRFALVPALGILYKR